MANAQAKSQIYHELWFDVRIRPETMPGGESGSQWMVLNRPLGQASDVLFARAQKAPKNRRKSSKRGLQWGRGTHTVRAPQFRGSLGFAG